MTTTELPPIAPARKKRQADTRAKRTTDDVIVFVSSFVILFILHILMYKMSAACSM